MPEAAEAVNDDSRPNSDEEVGNASKPKRKTPRPNGAVKKAKAKAKAKAKPRERVGTGSTLTPENVSAKALRVLETLDELDRAAAPAEVARHAWSGKKVEGDADKGSPVSAYRTVVNTVRRLIGAGWVLRAEAGSYKISAKGREKLALAQQARKGK